MATVSDDALAHTLRAVTGAAAVHGFDVLLPYSPKRRGISFERTVSHGRGRLRTYDRLWVRVGDDGALEYVRLVSGDGIAESDRSLGGDERHPFDVVDAFLMSYLLTSQSE